MAETPVLNLIHYLLMRLIILFIILLSVMVHAKAYEFPGLPDSIDGWTAEETEHFNNNESLYDYINGAAELYISYGYRSAISRRYFCEGQPDVAVEIFDMGTSENAYGVFSHTRYEEDYAFGQGSQYVEGALFFWKNNYYVSVMAAKETDRSKELVNNLGRIISDSINREGNLPGIIDLLPLNGLDKAGILYFHHYIWLNSYYYIADENIFMINDKTDAVLAKYGSPDERSYLLIIHYKDKGLSSEAYNNFLDKYFPEGRHANSYKLEDGKWIGAELSDNTLVAVFNGRSEEIVSALLSEVKLKLEKAEIKEKK